MVKLVKVKSDRTCKQCYKRIEKGSECGTFSEKYKGRSWVCRTCLSNNNFTAQFSRRFSVGGCAGEADLDEVDIPPTEEGFVF